MSRQLADLEQLLRLMLAEQQTTLSLLEQQEKAMRTLDAGVIEKLQQAQEASRMRLASLEQRRRLLTQQLARLLRLAHEPNLQQLADLHPLRRKDLLKLRAELHRSATRISERSVVANRLAGSVLGHLNTIVRLFAGAVERAGVYTKAGLPRLSQRIGVMEAVG